MADNNVFYVNVSPEMQMYYVLQRLSYRVETSLAEFIDNSIQSLLDNPKKLSEGIEISVSINSKNKTVIVEDNASGITKDKLEKALKPGFLMGQHDTDSLSVYGIGMKSASIWFSKEWTIETSPIGVDEKYTINFDLDKLISSGEHEIEVKTDKIAKDKHFTKIILKNHIRHEDEKHYKDRVIPYLKETFHRFDKASIRFYYDKEEILANPKKTCVDVPKPLIYPEVNKEGNIKSNALIKWRIDLDFEFEERSVKGFVLMREVGGYGQPGLRLLRNNRVIEGVSILPNIPKTLLGTPNKYAAQRIYGELDLNDFPVDFMKINFNENLERLYQHIKNKLASEYNVDFTFQVNHFRKGKVESDGNIKIVEQLQKLCKVIPIGKKGTEIPTVEIEPEKKANESKPSDNDSSASTKTEGSKDTNQAQKSTGSGDEEPTPIYVSKENKVAENAVLANRLLALGGEKLASVYKSLCSISLKNHSVLAYVGAWSLCEVLSVKFGKGDNQKFPAYFAQEIGKFASNRTEKNEIKMAFEDIAKKGNLHKHSGKFWNRDARDLIGMFEIITPFLIHVIDNYLEKDVRRQV